VGGRPDLVKTFTDWVSVAFDRRLQPLRRGWLTSISLRSDLAIDALEMAIYARGDRDLDGLIHHSARRVQ